MRPSDGASREKELSSKNPNGRTKVAYFKQTRQMITIAVNSGNESEEILDGRKQLLEDFQEAYINELIHAAKILRMAEKHKNIVVSWTSRQISLKCSEAEEANASPKHGLKRIAKQIGGGSAKPLEVVARDGMTNDGGW